MSRVYNFSAGPAVLPPRVLERVRQDIPSWKNSGMSVMEVSHRGKDFIATAEKTEQDLRNLLKIPDDYAVLFLQAGPEIAVVAFVYNGGEGATVAAPIVRGVIQAYFELRAADTAQGAP